MNIRKTLTIFLIALASFQIVAMLQPDLGLQLIHAAYEGNNERVEQLMLAGVPVDPQALFYPTMKGNYDVVKTIFESGVDPESPADTSQMFGGSTLFMHLVLNQKLKPQVKEKLVLLYLKHGADSELRNPAGFSMLVKEAHSIDLLTLKLLLEQGTYANARDDKGFTSLMTLSGYSPYFCPVKKAELLIKYKADVNLKNQTGLTSLMNAVMGENMLFVEFLLNHDADVNLKNEVGETCLMKAVVLENRTLVKLLLNNGADVDVKDILGQSALDYAKYRPKVLKLLKDAQKTKSEKSIDS